MNLKEAQAAFPPGSALRDILAGLLDQQAEVREEAHRRLRALDRLAPAKTRWRRRGAIPGPRRWPCSSSLLRRGGKVTQSALRQVAAGHETRVLLFQLLEGLGRLDLFPPLFRTWGAFAAADMVNWLLYPAELGREPDKLQQMAVFTSTGPEGELALYVWRFRSEDGPWYAGVSGPYLREGEPSPSHGRLTFSRFDEWG